jgi:hypothetical protein
MIYKTQIKSQGWWHMQIIPPTWEVHIRWIAVKGHTRQKVSSPNLNKQAWHGDHAYNPSYVGA